MKKILFGVCLLFSASAYSQTTKGYVLQRSDGVLTIGNGKTLTVSNSLVLSGTDASTLNIGAGGTLGSNAFTSTTYAPLASPVFTGTVTIPTPFTLGATSVTSTGTQLNYLNSATGTTGTASTNVVFSASPTFTGTVALGTGATVTSPSISTSLTTPSASFDNLNTTATTVNAYGATTTLTIGGTPTTAITHNYSTNATAAATTKTINLGTGGAASSTTNINVGSSNGGTFTINSPTTAHGTGSITMTGSIGVTGSRVTKLWATDIESTNMITVNGTSLSSTFQGLATNLTSIGALANASGYLKNNGSGTFTYETPAGAGTVTNTGNLTSNAVVLGNGTTDTKVSTGFTTDGTSILTLGVAGSSVGTVAFKNATSGTASLLPPTGALGTYSITLPNAASTLPIYGQQITYTGPTTARTVTYPDAAFSVARIDAAQTFTGVQLNTVASGQTGLMVPLQYAVIASDFTLSAASGAQNCFTTDRDTWTLEAGATYMIEGHYIMTTGTTTTKTTALVFGGTATMTSVSLSVLGYNAVPGTTATAQGTVPMNSLSSTVVTATATTAGVTISFWGTIIVNASGTFIPQINFSANPGGTNLVKAGSRISLIRLGTTNVQGNVN